MQLSINTEGQERLLRAFTVVAEDASDFRRIPKAVHAVIDYTRLMAREQITSKGRRGGHPYPPHAPSTIEKIRSGNTGGFNTIGELLRASDALFQAVGTSGAPGGVERVTEDEITVGTDLRSKGGFPYPLAHQRGGPQLPQRMIYDPTERDEREIVKVFKLGLEGKWESLGFEFKGTEIPF